MDENVTKKVPLKAAIVKKAFIIILIMLFIFLLVQVSNFIFFSNKVHTGVYINNEHVGGLTSEELRKKLNSEYSESLKASEIVLKTKNTTARIYLADLGVSFDISNAATQAYNTGRTGSLSSRTKEIIKTRNEGIHYNMPFSTDTSKVIEFANMFYDKTFIAPVDRTITVLPNMVEILSGQTGEKIDKTALISEINKAIALNKSSTIEVPLVKTALPVIKADDIFNLIHLEPKNAEFVINNKQADITPEENGRTIDKAALDSIVTDLNKTDSIVRRLPITTLYPEITATYLRTNVFSSSLASASTQFYTDNENNANRGNNIRLAVAKLNGTIIAPGESFSFNDVVGERTELNGYKVAHAYSDGKIIDDVGGGICQVSTTLYNAVVYADQQITLRINHMFTVGYIPLGMDAAVSFPDVDLRFVNTSSLPIQILGTVTNDNRVVFTIKGYVDTPGKTVEFYSLITDTYNFTTEYVDDTSIYKDEYVVIQGGMTGYSVDTYKIIRQNGKLVSEEKAYTSTYQPLRQIVARGVKAKPAE